MAENPITLWVTRHTSPLILTQHLAITSAGPCNQGVVCTVLCLWIRWERVLNLRSLSSYGPWVDRLLFVSPCLAGVTSSNFQLLNVILAQTLSSSPKVWDFDETRLHWVSVLCESYGSLYFFRTPSGHLHNTTHPTFTSIKCCILQMATLSQGLFCATITLFIVMKEKKIRKIANFGPKH